MKSISIEELKNHNHKNSLWIAIEGFVYDVTSFLDHPGQFDILLKYGGKDVTKKFNNIHSEKAFKMKDKYKIGKLKGIFVFMFIK